MLNHALVLLLLLDAVPAAHSRDREPAPAAVEIRFVQLAPDFREEGRFKKSAEQSRAIVLIHGIRPHPFSRDNVAEAQWVGWQEPESDLVKALAKDGDVFAVAYGQSEDLEKVSEAEELKEGIKRLKKMGYREIILIGHSAGGLIARHLVEDCPDIGITKVIQVCAPNEGTVWGKAVLGVREPQEKFLRSLSKRGRRDCLKRRAEKKIPKEVELVCVVGVMKTPGSVTVSLGDRGRIKLTLKLDELRSDGIVSTASQWPDDFQKQGIPAVRLQTTHITVMESETAAEQLGVLVRERQPRWDGKKVAEMRRKILGSDSQP